MDIPNPNYEATKEEWKELEDDINYILNENEKK